MNQMGRARDLIERFSQFASPDKALGQHFLHDDETLAKIAAHGGITAEDKVLEIGSGPGGLTSELLEYPCTLNCVEMDMRAISHLNSIFGEEINLIEGDVLNVELPDFNKIVANIPYQISSPLLERLSKIHRSQPIDRMVLLVQEEFAQRMKMDNPIDRCSLGMMLQLEWDIELAEKVPPHLFIPAPKVDSRIVLMTPKQNLPDFDLRLAKLIIHQAFAQRRKMLRNTLKKAPKRLNRIKGWHRDRWQEAIAKSSGLNRRPEEFSLLDWSGFIAEIANTPPSEG